MDTRVISLIQGDVDTLDMDVNVAQVEIAFSHGIHHLLVLEDGVVAGVISTLDVIRVLLAEPLA